MATYFYDHGIRTKEHPEPGRPAVAINVYDGCGRARVNPSFDQKCKAREVERMKLHGRGGRVFGIYNNARIPMYFIISLRLMRPATLNSPASSFLRPRNF
jgi:hypothetical protein